MTCARTSHLDAATLVSPGDSSMQANGIVAELPNPEEIAAEVEATLQQVEQRLLALVRDGARGTEELGEILRGLSEVAAQIRHLYLRLLEVQGRRDVSFGITARLEAVRRHSLWLYRKARLEEFFFAKLRLERALRDAIYRQIVETYQDMAALDDAERELRGRPDEVLTQDLLREAMEVPTSP
jgi:hypothetical protein